jgi:hypothetical protein
LNFRSFLFLFLADLKLAIPDFLNIVGNLRVISSGAVFTTPGERVQVQGELPREAAKVAKAGGTGAGDGGKTGQSA